ncbi:MAG: mannose-6-phosphate isomerase [Pusillimonas sp.]|nr:mannose-6-phosphate isomerase [Pusillimonas sp.]
MNSEVRPWGNYTNILDEDNCKVKKIKINPDQRPSLQYHNQRSEHWIIVQGTGLATVGTEDIKVEAGDHIFVPKLTKHRIKNIGNDTLTFIEVQCGTYFGEDDIVRLDDDYGRSDV